MVKWWCAKERINARGSYIFVKWSCAKEIINERGTCTFIDWSCANEINKTVGNLNSGRMVVHITSAKIPEREGSISPSILYGQLPDY